ncbi:phage Gp37/Gp68 family protein [Amorphus sp. 3PC139-8]|uniref:phage Gp37/Gp68 family protein n=1 Tax=Amorphus sp. 3PC139-8 TaxID=2735676 RepID=UPI00345D58C0
MSDHSPIEWTDATWNIVTGCTLVSDGCRHCYAARLAASRLKNHPSRKGLARLNASGEAKFTGEVRFNEQWLDQPLRWKRPRRIFVCAHGDLFHEAVPDAWIDRVFAVMALSPHHTFQVLTKRAARMRDYFTGNGAYLRVLGDGVVDELARAGISWNGNGLDRHSQAIAGATRWPLPNVWMGVSAEDQRRADERVPDLLATPAAVRFVSAEPLFGPIDFTNVGSATDVSARLGINALTGDVGRPGLTMGAGVWPPLDWIIVGGESGPGARPMHPDWVRRIRDDCAQAARSAEGATGVEYQAARSAEGATGVEYQAARSAEGATGVEYQAARSAGGATGVEYQAARSAEGATGVEYQAARSAEGATGVEYQAARSAGGTTGAKQNGVAFHFKQWGAWAPFEADDVAAEQLESDELEGRIDGWFDQAMRCVGKTAAGRTLDGVEHNGFPHIETRATP